MIKGFIFVCGFVINLHLVKINTCKFTLKKCLCYYSEFEYCFMKDNNDAIYKMFVVMHFIYYKNRSIATKADSTYLGY